MLGKCMAGVPEFSHGEVVAGKSFTLPTTQCGVQAAARRRVERASWELEARSTGSHCGGLTTAWSASASLLATQGFVVFGMKAKVAAPPLAPRTGWLAT